MFRRQTHRRKKIGILPVNTKQHEARSEFEKGSENVPLILCQQHLILHACMLTSALLQITADVIVISEFNRQILEKKEIEENTKKERKKRYAAIFSFFLPMMMSMTFNTVSKCNKFLYKPVQFFFSHPVALLSFIKRFAHRKKSGRKHRWTMGALKVQPLADNGKITPSLTPTLPCLFILIAAIQSY